MNPGNHIRQILSVVLILALLSSSAAFAQADEIVIVPDYGEMAYSEAHALFPDDYPLENADTTPVDMTPIGTTPVDTTPIDTSSVDYTPADNTPVHTTPVDINPRKWYSENYLVPSSTKTGFFKDPDSIPEVATPKQPPVWGEGLTSYVDNAITSLDETHAGDAMTIRADESGMTTISRTLLEKFEERGDVDLICVYDRFGETMQFTIPAGTSVIEHIGNASFVEYHNLANRLGLTPEPYQEKAEVVFSAELPSSAIPFTVQPSDDTVLSGLPVKWSGGVIQLNLQNAEIFPEDFEMMSEAEQTEVMLSLQDQQAAANQYLQLAGSQLDKDQKTISDVIASIGDEDTDARAVVFLPSASDPVNAVDMLIYAPFSQPVDYSISTVPVLSRDPKITVTPSKTVTFGAGGDNNVLTLTLPNNTVNALVEDGYTGEGLTQEETMDAIGSLLTDLASDSTLTQQPDQDVSILLVFEKEEEKVKYEETAKEVSVDGAKEDSEEIPEAVAKEIPEEIPEEVGEENPEGTGNSTPASSANNQPDPSHEDSSASAVSGAVAAGSSLGSWVVPNGIVPGAAMLLQPPQAMLSEGGSVIQFLAEAGSLKDD